MTELSVLVPSYCATDLLRDALHSLAAQEGEQRLAEIIVVDDGTPGFDAASLTGLTGRWPLTVIALEQNAGRAVARNRGLAAATGRIVVFLDGDMTVLPGFLRAHADFHHAHDDAIAVGDIRFGPSVAINAMTRYIHRRGVARYAAGPVPFKCFVTGNSSVPRAALLAAGGFDESFVTYGGEDLELGYRLHRYHGLTVHYLPDARSLHHHTRDFAAMADAMTRYGHDGVPQLLRRHPALDGVLRLDFLTAPRWHPRRLALQLALWSPLRQGVRALAGRLLAWPLPDLVFDYLWWSHRTHGYLRSTKDTPATENPS